MDALKAESLLKDSQLFVQIEKLCADLQYNTQDKQFAFDDYFKILVNDIDAVPRLQLENDVAPGTETIYTIQLTLLQNKLWMSVIVFPPSESV